MRRATPLSARRAAELAGHGVHDVRRVADEIEVAAAGIGNGVEENLVEVGADAERARRDARDAEVFREGGRLGRLGETDVGEASRSCRGWDDPLVSEPPSERAPRPHRAALTRGFLFADLRGYTAFVERLGAHRAAAMLDRYRELVRDAVAQFDGAEIRTEGDSFYVVFDSASTAIGCGLAIVAAAADATRSDTATPIQVGVGIHAGETVETAEGFVGSAVNTAARICAQAGPNEVLVSGTVRTLTGGVVDASFVPVGRRRLKGLNEPIQLYRAVSLQTPSSTRSVLPIGPMLAAIGLVGLLVVAFVVARPWIGAGNGAGDGGTGLASSPSASMSASVVPGTSASASPSEPVFPSGGEQDLLALITEADRDLCERAAPTDVPELRNAVYAGVPPQVYINRTPIQVEAGIRCSLGGISAPDTVWYWDLRVPSEAVEWIAEQGGILGATDGACATTTPAVEHWSFGGGGGRLLCFTTNTGDAVLFWTYDDSRLMGKAVRADMDIAAALQWWSEEARFLSD